MEYTARSRLSSTRTARSAALAVRPYLIPQYRNSGKTVSNGGNCRNVGLAPRFVVYDGASMMLASTIDTVFSRCRNAGRCVFGDHLSRTRCQRSSKIAQPGMPTDLIAPPEVVGIAEIRTDSLTRHDPQAPSLPRGTPRGISGNVAATGHDHASGQARDATCRIAGPAQLSRSPGPASSISRISARSSSPPMAWRPLRLRPERRSRQPLGGCPPRPVMRDPVEIVRATAPAPGVVLCHGGRADRGGDYRGCCGRWKGSRELFQECSRSKSGMFMARAVAFIRWS